MMEIPYNMITDGERFITPHHVHTRTGDGMELIVLSGVVKIHYKGDKVEDWRRDTLVLGISLKDVVPADKALKLEHWAAFVTINAVTNEHHSINGGHAVDGFWIINPDQEHTDYVKVGAAIAARDPDAYLLRVGYHVTLLGKFVDSTIGPLI